MFSNFVELTRFGGELSFCGPSDYIKISDDLYIYSRVEAEFSGTMTTYVLDVNRAEQIGVRLGFDETDTLEYLPVQGPRRVGRPDRAVRAVRRRRHEDRAGQSQPADREGRASGLSPDEDESDHDAGRRSMRPSRRTRRCSPRRARWPATRGRSAASSPARSSRFATTTGRPSTIGSTRSRSCAGGAPAKPARSGARSATSPGSQRPASSCSGTCSAALPITMPSRSSSTSTTRWSPACTARWARRTSATRRR